MLANDSLVRLHHDRAAAGQAAGAWLVLGLAVLLGAQAPDGMVLALHLTAFVVAAGAGLVLRRRQATLRSIAELNRERLVVWRFDAEAWARARPRRPAWIYSLVTPVVALGAVRFAARDLGDDGDLMTWVFAALLLLLAIFEVARQAEMRLRNLPDGGGEVRIGRTGMYATGGFWLWSELPQTRVLRIVDDDHGRWIEFRKKPQGRAVVRIPYPAGEAEAVERVAAYCRVGGPERKTLADAPPERPAPNPAPARTRSEGAAPSPRVRFATSYRRRLAWAAAAGVFAYLAVFGALIGATRVSEATALGIAAAAAAPLLLWAAVLAARGLAAADRLRAMLAEPPVARWTIEETVFERHVTRRRHEWADGSPLLLRQPSEGESPISGKEAWIGRRGLYLTGDYVPWSRFDPASRRAQLLGKHGDLLLAFRGAPPGGGSVVEIRAPVPPGEEALAERIARAFSVRAESAAVAPTVH